MLTNDDIMRTYPYLVKFARKLDYAHYEDLVHDTVVRGLLNADKFDGSNAKGWLEKLMYNIFSSKCRRSKKFDSQYDPEPIINGQSVTVDHNDTIMLRNTLREIEKLPYHRSEVIKELMIGASYQDVADKMQIPLGTVRSRVSRAREQLTGGYDEKPRRRIARNRVKAHKLTPSAGSAASIGAGDIGEMAISHSEHELYSDEALQSAGLPNLQEPRKKPQGRLKKFLLEKAPNFCWCSKLDLLMMMEQEDEDVDQLCFEQCLWRCVKEGSFIKKPSTFGRKNSVLYLRC